MRRHENTPGNIRDSQTEFLAQVRPPEENPTTTQDAHNEEEGHGQTETNQNNNQEPSRNAKGDVNKVGQDDGAANKSAMGLTDSGEKADNQDQHTRNTLIKIGNTHQEHASEELATSKRRHKKKRITGRRNTEGGEKATRNLKCPIQRMTQPPGPATGSTQRTRLMRDRMSEGII